MVGHGLFIEVYRGRWINQKLPPSLTPRKTIVFVPGVVVCTFRPATNGTCPPGGQTPPLQVSPDRVCTIIGISWRFSALAGGYHHLFQLGTEGHARGCRTDGSGDTGGQRRLIEPDLF